MRHASILIIAAGLLAGCATELPPPPRAYGQTTPPPSAPAPEAAPASSAQAPDVNATPMAPASSNPDAPPPPAASGSGQKPEQTETGRYSVVVAAERTPELAAPWVRKLESDGFKVTTQTADVGGTSWTRVVLPGLASKADAMAMISTVASQYSVQGAWILPRNAPASAAAIEAPPAPSAPPPPPPPPPEGQPQN